MPRAELAASLEQGARAQGISLAAGQRDTLLEYLALLQRWNRAYNLTAVREPLQMVSRHLLDSLSVMPFLRGPLVLDVGSGAGLPGLVLAVASPDLRVTLLDPSLKRTRFLENAVRELGLENVRVVRARLEAHGADPGYDTLVSRATLSLEDLCAAAPGVLAAGGRLVAMLGRAPETLPAGGSGALRVVRLDVPGLKAERHAALLDLAG